MTTPPITHRPLHIPDTPRETKHSVNIGDTYKMEDTPLNEAQYRNKVNYQSYFHLMGVPQKASEDFHIAIYNRDIDGAIEAVQGSFTQPECVRNLRMIRRHLVNAVERYKPELISKTGNTAAVFGNVTVYSDGKVVGSDPKAIQTFEHVND